MFSLGDWITSFLDFLLSYLVSFIVDLLFPGDDGEEEVA